MTEARALARVAVFAPLRQTFDYLVPAELDPATVRPGARVEVPFGKRHRAGIVVAIAPVDAPERPLKPLVRVLEPDPCFGAGLLRLLTWAARYYQHPIGEVFAAALPRPLRTLAEPDDAKSLSWRLAADDTAAGARGTRQRELIERLAAGPLAEDELAAFDFDARAALRRLVASGRVIAEAVAPASTPVVPAPAPFELSAGQTAAVDAIEATGPGFAVTLLEGVTGSGKTEVYLELAARTLARGRRVLVLVPEIGLTHALVDRFRARFGSRAIVYHSGLADGRRQRHWTLAREGGVDVVLGTRSALWLPLADLGLLVVDEEHDESYKQQEGFRYSGRDTAVMRGAIDDVPVVLGSATPSLESLANVERGKYAHTVLAERAAGAAVPEVELVDVRGERLEGAIGARLTTALEATLARGEQALLFVNRRGFAPTVLCAACGTAIECRRCSAPMVHHVRPARMVCHHCGATARLAAPCDCGDAFEPILLGAGTERVHEAIAERFPDHVVARIDRDSVRSDDRRASVLADLVDGRIDIAVGTRMIAKGHHFPKVTLVGIVDADARLFSADFRAPERLAQTIVQVAGRAGRATLPGRVLIQTRNPGHPLFATLLGKGYPAAAREMLALRRETSLPPFSTFVLVRADSKHETRALDFLTRAAKAIEAAFAAHGARVTPFGPFSAPLARKAGYHRAQLWLELARDGAMLDRLDALTAAVAGLDVGREVRWSVDVDPIEMG